MYRREAVQRIGGYRSIFDGSEDYDLWIRLAREGDIANLNEHLTKYRIWNGQDTTEYLSEKNIRAYQVQLSAELEEIAPKAAKELFAMKLQGEKFTAAAESCLMDKALFRFKRLECTRKLNEVLILKNKIPNSKFALAVFLGFFQISWYTLLVQFNRAK
jgi:hypothetical protein